MERAENSLHRKDMTVSAHFRKVEKYENISNWKRASKESGK